VIKEPAFISGPTLTRHNTEDELEDRALLDTVITERSDEDDSARQDFIWEDMEHCEGQRENFMGSVGPQGAAKLVMYIVDIVNCFSVKN
jgi:hypothetical protein